MAELGTLKELKNLREVWAHEALDFTPWLANDENISLLADAVGLVINVDETESSVGSFHADILATEENTGQKIIIENQLEDSNHDHLGKLITYAAGKSADIVIWIVKHARDEHKAAIEWLNNHTDERIGFFLCEVKLFKIDDSDPAVKFEVIEKPNEWAREIRQSDSLSDLKQARYSYWEAFQNYAFQNAEFAQKFRRVKSSVHHWLNFSAGSSAYHFSIKQVRKRNILSVGLYIDDKNLFNALFQNKDAIESETDLAFNWRELPDKDESQIILEKEVAFDDEIQHAEQFSWLVEVMNKMKPVFKKYLS